MGRDCNTGGLLHFYTFNATLAIFGLFHSFRLILKTNGLVRPSVRPPLLVTAISLIYSASALLSVLLLEKKVAPGICSLGINGKQGQEMVWGVCVTQTCIQEFLCSFLMFYPLTIWILCLWLSKRQHSWKFLEVKYSWKFASRNGRKPESRPD